ncbi:MAG: DEAD/DEAH box helicase [Planctomycetes bacterium]|nr:DEAD/DEAH box helicase [Planctomycetota bacterium]
MTPIEAESLPPGHAGRDLIAQAKAGSGKTAAFALVLLSRLTASRAAGVQALVLSPTRELAEQVAQEIRRLARLLQGLVNPLGIDFQHEILRRVGVQHGEGPLAEELVGPRQTQPHADRPGRRDSLARRQAIAVDSQHRVSSALPGRAEVGMHPVELGQPRPAEAYAHFVPRLQSHAHFLLRDAEDQRSPHLRHDDAQVERHRGYEPGCAAVHYGLPRHAPIKLGAFSTPHRAHDPVFGRPAIGAVDPHAEGPHASAQVEALHARVAQRLPSAYNDRVDSRDLMAVDRDAQGSRSGWECLQEEAGELGLGGLHSVGAMIGSDGRIRPVVGPLDAESGGHDALGDQQRAGEAARAREDEHEVARAAKNIERCAAAHPPDRRDSQVGVGGAVGDREGAIRVAQCTGEFAG